VEEDIRMTDDRITNETLSADLRRLSQSVSGLSGGQTMLLAAEEIERWRAGQPVPEVGEDDPRIAIVATRMMMMKLMPLDQFRRNFPACTQHATEIVAALDAADPLRQPVSGDRVEVAEKLLDEILSIAMTPIKSQDGPNTWDMVVAAQSEGKQKMLALVTDALTAAAQS